VSQAAEILTELQRRGVIVAIDGDTLCLKPRRALDDTLLARVREAKPAILEALRGRPATCSPDCYELEPGIWIHRPHTGCITIKPEASGSQRKVAVMCWHCQGEKRCTCIACWQTGQCVTCKGTGQIWRWIQ
jgi:hypothetical protein